MAKPFRMPVRSLSLRSRWRVVLLMGLAAPALVLAPPSSANPPSDPTCLPLLAGSTGVLVAGGQIPSQEQLQGERGGFGPVAAAAVARTLPDAVVFKSNRETFSNEYAFVLRSGRLYVRPAVLGRGLAGQPWHLLELPSCLDGHVQQVSSDGRVLLALGPGRQLYSHDMPGGDLSPERWTWRWGPYFMTGAGLQMLPDVRSFSASELTTGEHFTDSSGRQRTPLGVATVYLLRGDRRSITYLDPWLPADESREVCGPDRGTLPLAGLSGSGSTVLVVDEQGGLWTRLYDFDVSGANTVFGDYSWQQGRPASDTRWQLPGPGWVRHTSPPGKVTDRVSLAKTGLGSADRLLRVEGRDRAGHAGYWEKRLDARAWRFVATGAPLLGRLLPLTGTRSFAADDRLFRGTIGGARVTARDVNPECSPAHLRVEIAAGVRLDLLLHLSDGLRQETRARGLDDTPREYNGALEIPAAEFAGLGHADPRLRTWVADNLGGQRITTAPVALTSTRLRFLNQCWLLTLNGGTGRPDVPRVPVDLGAVVGRTTQEHEDGRAPTVCP